MNKSLLNASGSAIRQLEPIKYDWAYEAYQKQVANFWLPTEVSMGDDISHWRSDRLSTNDRNAIKTTLAFFSCFEFEVANNLAINLYRHVTNPECRMFLLAQGCIEAVHQQAYALMVESLGVDKTFAYEGHKNIASIKKKTEWSDAKTKEISDASFSTETFRNRQQFLLNILAFMLLEGVSFYGGFAVLSIFRQRNLMPGMAKQIVFIARDENLHCEFAARLAASLIKEEPELFDASTAGKFEHMALEVMNMELDFVRETVPTGLPGMGRESLESHITYLTQRRVAPFGLQLQDEGKPMNWLMEALEIRKEENFFEGSVSNYAKGGLDWEEGKPTEKLSWEAMNGS